MNKITAREFENLSIIAKAQLLEVFLNPEDVTDEVVNSYMIMMRQDQWFENIHNLIQNEHSRSKQHIREGIGQYQQNILKRLEDLEKLMKSDEESQD